MLLKELINSDQSSFTESLTRATVRQFGGIQAFNEQWQDVANYGIDGGFSGFIYYSDTVSFADENHNDIVCLLREQAAMCGFSMSELLSSFNCLDLSRDEAELFLCGQINDSNEEDLLQNETLTSIKNALAWFTGEELCRVADAMSC